MFEVTNNVTTEQIKIKDNEWLYLLRKSSQDASDSKTFTQRD